MPEESTVLFDGPLPEDTGATAELAERLDAVLARAGLPPDWSFPFNLAVDELLTNLRTHGGTQGSPPPNVVLRLICSPEAVRVELTDDGAAFDPLSLPAPDRAAGIEARPVGGLGIHLVRSLMDEVGYRRANGRNHVTLTKRRPPDGVPA